MRKKHILSAGLLIMTMTLAVGCGKKAEPSAAPTETSELAEEAAKESSSAAVEEASAETKEEIKEDKKDEKDVKKAEADKKAKEQYLAFLNGTQKAQTADFFKDDDKEGNFDELEYGSYTYDELKAIVDEMPVIADSEMDGTLAKCALVDFGNDGVSELVLRFESENTDYLNMTVILHYDGSELKINGAYTDGYRTYAKLYTSGYLWSGGSFGAGATVNSLSVVDSWGEIHKAYSVSTLYGLYADNVAYEVDPDFQGFKSDYSALGEMSELVVTAYEASEDDPIYIACDDWSEDPKVRNMEERMIGELEELGVKQISLDEMDEKIKMPQVLYIEPSWKSVLPDMTMERLEDGPVSASFASELLMERPDTYISYVDNQTDYSVNILFNASEEVTDVRFCYFESEDLESFAITDTVYTLDKLTPEKPLLITTTFMGDIPNSGIVFTDASGNEQMYLVGESGYDGSLYLQKAELKK